MGSSTQYGPRSCRLDERPLLLGLGILNDVWLGNVHVFGHRMGKDKAKAQKHYCNSRPMAEPPLTESCPEI